MKRTLLKLFASLLVVGFIDSSLVYAKGMNDQFTQAESQKIELSREDFHPAFTKATVIKLNAIVARSLEVINQYDSIMNEVRQVQEAPVSAQNFLNQITDINQLSERSKLILSDMLVAENELKESDEIFNKAILAGMKKFVVDVEHEVTAQRALLSQSLSQR